MTYEITNRIRVGKNTAITINGNGKEIKNGMYLNGKHKRYTVLSVGMTAVSNVNEIFKTTDLLIEGECTENEITL